MNNTFLKWAGGKRWFVNNEIGRFPTVFNNYIEPFLGGGSVFFNLQPERAILSDINSELINTYVAVRDNFELVYHNLKIHQKNHCKDYYYEMREKTTKKAWTSAARMIYLNKACFNGIYRVNKSGKFNVPFGMSKNISWNRETLLELSNTLQNMQLLCQDFETTIDMAQEGDFVFCDPPYAVIDENNRFIGYNPQLFSWSDQIRLAKTLIRAKERNVKIVMTNVEHQDIRDLYSNSSGFVIDTVQRNCFISGTVKGRKIYKELIVSYGV